MGATGATGNSGGSDTTGFDTFLFRTFGIDIRVTSGDFDRLCRL